MIPSNSLTLLQRMTSMIKIVGSSFNHSNFAKKKHVQQNVNQVYILLPIYNSTCNSICHSLVGRKTIYKNVSHSLKKRGMLMILHGAFMLGDKVNEYLTSKVLVCLFVA